MRTALLSELEIIREAYKDRIDMLGPQNSEKSFVLVPIETVTSAYDRLIEQLGLLSASEIRAVMRAYVLVRQLPERVRLMEQRDGVAAAAPNGFINVPGTSFKWLRKMHENYLQDIDAALTALKHPPKQNEHPMSQSTARRLTIWGLVIGLLGVIILFRYGMPFHVPTNGMTIPSAEQENQTDISLEHRYTIYGYIGLACLIVGTGLQIAALWQPRRSSTAVT